MLSIRICAVCCLFMGCYSALDAEIDAKAHGCEVGEVQGDFLGAADATDCLPANNAPLPTGVAVTQADVSWEAGYVECYSGAYDAAYNSIDTSSC